jgi:hypothetical protein
MNRIDSEDELHRVEPAGGGTRPWTTASINGFFELLFPGGLISPSDWSVASPDLRDAYIHPIEKAQEHLLKDREEKTGRRIDEDLAAEDTFYLVRKKKLP